MTLRTPLVLALLYPVWSQGQFTPNGNVVSVSGTADVKVPPDQVQVSVGVESRDRILANARADNDAKVKAVLAAIERLQVSRADVQTGYISVDIEYNSHAQTIVDHYSVEKAISVTLRDVAKFETLLGAVLDAGANHIYAVEFSTTQLRKYRDQARAMAVKAATEKANDLAAAAGLKVAEKPVSISGDSFGGGFWYGRRSPYQTAANFSQNVIQSGDSGAGMDTIALGKITVSATVTLTFRLE